MEKDAERAAKALAKVKEERKEFALQPDVFAAAKLVKRKELNEDTRFVSLSDVVIADIAPTGRMNVTI